VRKVGKVRKTEKVRQMGKLGKVRKTEKVGK
jgi:hypothetical protein